jgi:hypothetical protein
MDSELLKTIREAVRAELQNMWGEQLLAPAEAIKLFNPTITKLTLQRWTDDGLIPMQRLGGRIFYKRSDILDAQANHKKYSHI